MIHVYTEHTPNIGRIVEITLPGKQEYAATHGYGMICQTMRMPYATMDRFMYWGQALENIAEDDWLFCIESDALITNHTIKLESLIAKDDADAETDLIVACDGWGLNVGTMLLRNTAQSRSFMKVCLETSAPPSTIEQVIMACRLAAERSFRAVQMRLASPPRVDGWPMYPSELKTAQEVYNGSAMRVDIRTQREMNAYPAEVYKMPPEIDHLMWNPGDFVVHVPGIANEVRLPVLESYLDEVIK